MYAKLLPDSWPEGLNGVLELQGNLKDCIEFGWWLQNTHRCVCMHNHNRDTHTQNFKTRSNTGAQFHVFLLLIFTLGTISLKLVGFFSWVKLADSSLLGQQTTTDVIRSLVLQDIHTDHCRVGKDFYFLTCAGLHNCQRI